MLVYCLAASVFLSQLTTWNNDDQQQDNDANDDAHSHLHVLPPHLLANTVGTAAKAVGLCGEVVGLVLQAVEAFATF